MSNLQLSIIFLAGELTIRTLHLGSEDGGKPSFLGRRWPP